MFIKAIAPSLYGIKSSMNACADIQLLKAKVPRICPSTAGVPARREGRYSRMLRSIYIIRQRT
jgi:hypothetical protein